MKQRATSVKLQRGVTLIEVLIAMLIASFGLLGMAGLQARAMNAEFESYQRSQAIVLATDMAERVRMNRSYKGTFKNISDATTGTGFVGTAGTGHYALDCTSTDHGIQALCDWDALLTGGTEQSGLNNVGAMIGARGCVSYDASTEVSGAADSGEFTVAVVWQGNAETAAPKVPGTDANLNCANNLYTNSAGQVRETMRRGVAIKFRFANLTN